MINKDISHLVLFFCSDLRLKMEYACMEMKPTDFIIIIIFLENF